MVTKEQILAVLEPSRIPCVRIAPEPGRTPSPTDSKFGGEYYLPAGVEPSDLEFLAQINLAQVPPLDGFPETGLLQFFLCTEDEAFENFLDEGSAYFSDSGFFQVRWYPEAPADGPGRENALPEKRWNMDKVSGGMCFLPDEQGATIALGESGVFFDLGFEYLEDALTALFQNDFDEDDYDDEDEEDENEDEDTENAYDLSGCEDTDRFCRDFGNWGFQFGGHPALRQGEVRLEDEAFEAYSELLFQYDLTSVDAQSPQYLEADTFGFFIKPEDLAARRFDDLLMVHHNCF